MLQMLTELATAVASEQVSFTAAPTCPPVPAPPDMGERSVKHLMALADLAYAAGDRASAEDFIRRIYAYYDQQAGEVE